MDNRVIELAEKIYAGIVCQIGDLSNSKYIGAIAEDSINAAAVFYGVKKKMMMNVKNKE